MTQKRILELRDGLKKQPGNEKLLTEMRKLWKKSIQTVDAALLLKGKDFSKLKMSKTAEKELERLIGRLLISKNETDRKIALACYLEKAPRRGHLLARFGKIITNQKNKHEFQSAVDFLNANGRSTISNASKKGTVNYRK